MKGLASCQWGQMIEWPKERSEGWVRWVSVRPEREIRLTNLSPKLTQIWINGGTCGAKKKGKASSAPVTGQPIAEL